MKHINFSKKNKGFTLIEIMVSITVFAVVILFTMGSIISVYDANRKSKTLRSVMDNFNITLESMTRTIRFGTNYHCGSSGNTTLPLDCGNPGDSNLTVRSADGSQITYSLSGGRIARSINGGTNYFLTSSDLTITRLAFRVYGSAPFSGGSDMLQPQVIVVIGGSVGVKNSSKSTFNLETTISQRLIDFQ